MIFFRILHLSKNLLLCLSHSVVRKIKNNSLSGMFFGTLYSSIEPCIVPICIAQHILLFCILIRTNQGLTVFQIVEPPYTISLLTIFPFLEHGEIYWWNTALWHVYAILNVVCMMKKCILKLQNTEALDCNICILLLCIIIRGEKQLCNNNNNGMIFHHEFTTNSKTDSWLPIK